MEISPDIEAMVRLKDMTGWNELIVEAGGKLFMGKGIFMAESSFFGIFYGRFLSGDPASALAHPSALVLTESAALKYFGRSDPLGETLTIRDIPFQVTAVISDPPANSHFQYSTLIAASAQKALDPASDDQFSWTSANYKTYLKLTPGADVGAVESRVNTLYSEGREDPPDLRLQALVDIHLRSRLRGEFEANGDIRNVRFAGAVGFILLMTAVLNFMNLASAHSLHRSREIGMRKVLGARRPQLIRQFLGEALVFVGLAAGVSLGLVAAMLPQFRSLTGSQVGWDQGSWGGLALFLAAVIGLVGTAAGSYPAFFASGFQPARALRGDVPAASRRLPLRNLLVGIQFTVTLVFVCSTLFVWSQMRYVKRLQLDAGDERIVTIDLPRAARHHHLAIKSELASHPGIRAACSSNFLPSTNDENISSTWEGRVDTGDVYLNKVAVDLDFLNTFGIEVIAGEPFSRKHRPGGTYMVNETAARIIGDGVMERAVGKTLTMHTWSSRPGPIIGVVRDFHYRSQHQEIGPLVLFLDSSRTVANPYRNEPYRIEPFRYVSARVGSRDLPEVLELVRTLCSRFIPYAPDAWSFFDKDFDRVYAAERRTARFLTTFALAALILASMGLLGLSMYSVQNRRKEIGIRRVLGASAPAILFLFFKDFLRIHLWSMLIAFPIIGIAMHRWLNNFAYRISLVSWIFAAGALLTAALFFVTSSLNVVKKAAADPVDTLRSE
jgi:putative ABC transport system permease protein